MNYYFTIHGDIYAGEELSDPFFPDRKIIIQRSKLQDYLKLPASGRTDAITKQHGWILKAKSIAGETSERFFPQREIIDLAHVPGWDRKYERKHLFIIGAGASANCVASSGRVTFDKDILKPPLGLELFQERFQAYYERYEAVKQSLHFLQDITANIEALFQQEWQEVQENANNEIISRHINIQYYLQELLRDVTQNTVQKHYAKNLYASLACELQKIYARQPNKKFAFVTFNQDTILEHFLERYFKRGLISLDSYVDPNNSPFCIFKPHGSWNWGWKFPDAKIFNGNTSKWLFDNNINYFNLYFELLGHYTEMVDPNSFGIEWSLNKHYLGKLTVKKSKISLIKPTDNLGNYFPALLLPYKDKDEFTMPPSHYNAMSGYIGEVESLIIIGWKGNEEAFNKVLQNNGHRIRKIVIVDPNPSQVKANLHSILVRPGIEIVEYADFEEFVGKGLVTEVTT